MATTRFKGESGSDRLGVSTITDSDMIQVRHKPGTVDDADKGVSKAVLNSCPFGVSSTAVATAAKTAALTDSNPDFTLLSGREVVVYFSTANSAASPTLNFAGSGANPIYYPDGTAVGDWDAGTWMHLKYFEATIDNSLIQRWICLSPVVADAVADGDKRPISSNAVFDFPIDSVASGQSRPATSNAVFEQVNSFVYTKEDSTPINIATTSGYRSSSYRTGIPYDSNYVYIINTQSVEDVRVIDSRDNSLIYNELCILATAPKSVTLSSNYDFYITKIKKYV